MDATDISNQKFEVLTADEYHTFRSALGAVKPKVPTSAQLKAALYNHLEQSFDSNKRFKRRLESIFASGVLTLGIGLGLSYSAHASAPMDARGGSPTLQSANTASTTAISQSTTSLPAQIRSLRYSTGFNGVTAPTIKSPQWMPAPYSQGDITQSGDIALIDAVKSATTVKITVLVDNQKDLKQSYQTFVFPIDIYRCNPAYGKCGSKSNRWHLVEAPTSSGTYSVSNTQSTFSAIAKPGYFYDLAMQAGQGAFHANSLKSATSNTLSPRFSITSSAQ